MSKRLLKSVTGFAILALMALTLGFFAPFSSVDSAVANAAQAPKVKIAGQTPNAAQHGSKVAHKSSTDTLNLAISLNYRNKAQLVALLAGISDPTSSQYHHYLTSEQFASQFGATSADAAKVKAFLERNGMRVTSISPDNTLINVSGTTAQAEAAFSTTINNYQSAKGTYYAYETDPLVSADVSGLILGVQGLENEPRWRTATPHGKPIAAPHVGSGPAGGYTPAELRGAYNVNPLISAGYTGAGQTAAVFELDGYVASNISTYVSNYGLGSPAPSNILVDGYNGAAGQGEVEVELDIEVINAIAPKAQVLVYEGPNSSAGVVDTYKKIATDNTAKVISSSWGQCENESAQSDINSEDQVYQQYAAQGQSIFSAAGDTGAYDCRDQATLLNVDNPSDDTYVTGVGGTNLTISGTSYSSETVWNASASSAGGGGISTLFTKPSYQTGPGTTNSYSNGERQVPDVTAVADPASGYSIYSQGSWTVVGGTSAAAPLWAGIATLSNNYAASNGKASLGQANPTLYSIFNNATKYANDFHDITSGTNRYYPATSGYDQASGIGSPNAYNLVLDINGSITPPPTTTPPTTTTTPVPTTTPTGGSTQLIQNGGFESGNTNWTESSSGGYEIVDSSTSSQHHAGSASAWMCGYTSCTDTIYQAVSIPSNATSATLSYYVYVSSAPSSSDSFKAQLRNSSGTVLSTLQTLSSGTTTGTWLHGSFDVTSKAGQTVQVFFAGVTSASDSVSYFLDDVTLNVTTGGTPTTTTPAPTTTTPAPTTTTPAPTTTTPAPTTTTPVPTTTTPVVGQQLITNGGFESGNANWTESSSSGYEIVDSSTSSQHHAGSASAWLCGYNNCADSIYQTITIPSNVNGATLTFWVYVSTQETSHAYDYFYAKVRNSSGTVLATATTLSDGTATGWKQYTANLTAYKGQTVQIYFNATNDTSNPTSFFLDDVSVATN
jgi:kumamolisin